MLIVTINCYKGFTVSGRDIIDPSGKVFMMRGINHGHAWFKDDIESAIASIAETGANIIRIVLANGKKWAKDEPESVRKMISLCESHKLIVMFDVHDATGSDNLQDLKDAIAYWKELKDIIVGKEDQVIINIANEWYGSWDSSGWAEGNKYAVQELRNFGFEHLIVVDAAGYGQYPQSIFEKGNEVFQADRLARTVLSIHMYEYAGGDSANIKSNIDKSLQMSFPVILGEFGDRLPQEKPTDVSTILSYAQEKKMGWIAWSWYGNSGTDVALDMTNGPSGGYTLTAFGDQVVNQANGIRQTSVKPIN